MTVIRLILCEHHSIIMSLYGDYTHAFNFPFSSEEIDKQCRLIMIVKPIKRCSEGLACASLSPLRLLVRYKFTDMHAEAHH